jgi:putative nucleotidyltransferase with HDIG domain
MGNARIPPGPALIGRALKIRGLNEIAAHFTSQGIQLYLVGGAVRDLVRGGTPHDWDLATDAPPDEVIRLSRSLKHHATVIPTGIQHGTVTLRYRGGEYEITTFRTESDYQDGRRPRSVAFARTIQEDLSRRDFTMNAVALSFPGGETVDPFEGIADIKKRRIRCVGNPLERFAEDGLRSLRALRFAAQLGFTVDPPTLAAIRPSLEVTAQVSEERIRDELNKIVASPQPSAAFRLMEQTGLLDLVLPELSACRGVEQKGFHRFDVLDHSLLACDYAARQNYPMEVRLAALFHDIGKPGTRLKDDRGIWTFYQHEKRSAHMTEQLMSRLRYSVFQRGQICRLIGCHMFHYEDTWSDGAVRRFIIRAGEENLDNLYRLRRADAYGMTGDEASPLASPGLASPPASPDSASPNLAALIHRVDRVLAENHALSLKDLAISGKDLIAAGIEPGKYMGIILNELLETVVDDPASNNRETLLRIALCFNRNYQ